MEIKCEKIEVFNVIDNFQKSLLCTSIFQITFCVHPYVCILSPMNVVFTRHTRHLNPKGVQLVTCHMTEVFSI